MKEALEATFPQLSRDFFHMNAGRDEPGTTTPLAENSLHLDLCTYIPDLMLDLWYSSAI